MGFNMRKVSKGGVTIKLWDLGGQARLFLLLHSVERLSPEVGSREAWLCRCDSRASV